MQTCQSVGESAPAFVGCSPGGLTSAVIVGAGASTTTGAASKPVSTSTMSMFVTTVSGPVEQLTSLAGSMPVTATYAGNALLSGSCTTPYFAMVTDSTGQITEFLEIGCSPNRRGCCPYDSHQNAVITKCPSDYFTTAGACCPS